MPRKCYNSFATCVVPGVFNKLVKTLRFADARPNLPKAGGYFPALLSVSTRAATVNLAGSEASLAAIWAFLSGSVPAIRLPF